MQTNANASTRVGTRPNLRIRNREKRGGGRRQRGSEGKGPRKSGCECARVVLLNPGTLSSRNDGMVPQKTNRTKRILTERPGMH